MNNKPQLSRKEFEQAANEEVTKSVAQAKQIRDTLRKLESDISKKEEKIRKYQKAFSELEVKLVKIQTKLYAGGTT